MNRTHHRRRWGALGAAAASLTLLLAGCTGPTGSGGDDDGSAGGNGGRAGGKGDLTIAVVTHGGSGDAFWSVVKTGAEAAGKELGVTVQYSSDGDPAKQATLVDNAVAQKVDGLVVSMANPDALQGAIEKAVTAGIQVITINSGEDKSAAFGAIAHVGQNEGIAGEGAGQRLKDAGRTKVLCVVHEAGNVGLTQRCDGAKRALGGITTLQVDLNNPTDVQARIRGALQADQSIDGVLTLNPQVAAVATQAVKAANSKAQIATFDLNADVVAAIKEGSILFAVDQQQYLQGYLPVVMLKLYASNANTVGGGRPVLTGPGFVDKSNADKVADYAKRGTR